MQSLGWYQAGASVILGVAGQLLFRRFGMSQTDWPQFDRFALPAEPGWLIVGVACYGVAVLLWVNVLRGIPLSRAYPLLSLGYPLVYGGAALWLGEAFTLQRTLGTALVCVGVLLAVAPSSAPASAASRD